MNESDTEAERIVAQAIERGVTYFDVAPSYGNAEEQLGPALAPYRNDVFLACKSNVRDGAGASAEFERSLQNLRTDHFDLYQIHGIQTEEEVDAALAPDGILAFMQRMREEGRIRYLGFSAHHEDAALRLLDAFDFDSILFPINRFSWHSGNVGRRIIDAAGRTNTEVLALKALALRRWKPDEEKSWSKTWYKPVDTPEEAELGLRFTLSRPVSAAVSPGHEELLWWACDAADRFRPLSPEEEETVALESVDPQPVFSRTVTAI